MVESAATSSITTSEPESLLQHDTKDKQVDESAAPSSITTSEPESLLRHDTKEQQVVESAAPSSITTSSITEQQREGDIGYTPQSLSDTNTPSSPLYYDDPMEQTNETSEDTVIDLTR